MQSKNPWLLLVFLLVPISLIAFRPRPEPSIIVWAWERPEKLDFINTDQIAVAFLAKTLRLEDDRVISRPRMQPLELAPGTKLIAVVRIESNHPTLSHAQLQNAVHEITKVSVSSNTSVIQIDFDATVSQRKFYKDLLNEVRGRLSSSTALSITALASWCAGDYWLSDLPIDEAVPMLFRMGIDARQFQSGQQLTAPICANSAGVSTDEPIARPDVDRLYIFSPNPWSRDSLNRALETYKK
jgi:uncharacterized protein DUF3142